MVIPGLNLGNSQVSVNRTIGPTLVSSLPDELLLNIFSYLNAGDLLTAARVCKRWQPLASDKYVSVVVSHLLFKQKPYAVK